MSIGRTLFARTILAVLVTVALVLLPIGRGMALTPAPTVTAVVVPMADCCHCDDGMSIDRMGNECQKGLGCAKCLSLYAEILSGPVLHLPIANAEPALLTRHLHSATGAPPFRPPRV